MGKRDRRPRIVAPGSGPGVPHEPPRVRQKSLASRLTEPTGPGRHPRGSDPPVRLAWSLLWLRGVPPLAYDAVNPWIDTVAAGNPFSGATLPLGRMQRSPDTRADGC